MALTGEAKGISVVENVHYLQDTLPKTNIPLKINTWKMTFPFGDGLFSGANSERVHH